MRRFAIVAALVVATALVAGEPVDPNPAVAAEADPDAIPEGVNCDLPASELGKEAKGPSAPAGLDAEVGVEVTICTDGIPRFPRVVRSSDRRFEEVAIRKARAMRFEPLVVDGAPVASKRLLSIRFRKKEGGDGK